jgi:hypothetical protein
MKSKSMEAFVRRSIKADTAAPDIAELQRLLDQISTTEMQQFWMHFAADRAFSTASTTVPHWKTKEQEVCFQHEDRRAGKQSASRLFTLGNEMNPL